MAKQFLEKRLASCVKFLPINSVYRWKGTIEKSSEILLFIDSIQENFDAINNIVKQLHSYETYNLVLIPITKTTQDVLSWLKEEIENTN